VRFPVKKEGRGAEPVCFPRLNAWEAAGFAAAENAVILCCGTSTMETLAAGRPMIREYKKKNDVRPKRECWTPAEPRERFEMAESDVDPICGRYDDGARSDTSHERDSDAGSACDAARPVVARNFDPGETGDGCESYDDASSVQCGNERKSGFTTPSVDYQV
jgi:hypothetical protein